MQSGHAQTMKPARSALATAALCGLAAVGLAACANPQAEQAVYAQQAFIGMPVQTLLACAGVPERRASVDNVDYFTYSSERIITRPATMHGYSAWHPWYGWGPYWGYGPGWGWNDYPEIESRSCEATFTLKNGAVTQVVYGGASSGSVRLGQCYQIVENCLSLIPRQTAQQGMR
ncbi:hypothetical protein [Rhodospirillum centenum]|uniref:Lipoprotein n=1 Tax=Rhodospirillum centenum (strain ATCC 51521 / SW) TaxID=414684 RepID=B6IR56_RHOCS|nr:hypothetical protein [Rhodospirillum centenum]ACI97942.1 hypothetical protein RC1_0505 [Rhodospirillum centenum SW]